MKNRQITVIYDSQTGKIQQVVTFAATAPEGSSYVSMDFRSDWAELINTHCVDVATQQLIIRPDLEQEKISDAWRQVRLQRNRLLSASDWTQVSDNNLTQEQRAAWAEYRQQLRDITTTTTDPRTIQWPQKP